MNKSEAVIPQEPGEPKKEGVRTLEQGKTYRATRNIEIGSGGFSFNTTILAGTQFEVVRKGPSVYNSAQYGAICDIKILNGKMKGTEFSFIPSVGFLNSIEEVPV